MQKVIIDTNVLVSSLIQKSYPHYIVRGLFLSDKFKLCISESLLWEYMLLELADESNANFLITGNVNDFVISKYKETLIVSPVDYWDNFKPNF